MTAARHLAHSLRQRWATVLIAVASMAAMAATATWYARAAGPLLSAVFGVATSSEQRVAPGSHGSVASLIVAILLVTGARGLAVVAGGLANSRLQAGIANDFVSLLLSRLLRLDPAARRDRGPTELGERAIADSLEMAELFQLGILTPLRNGAVAASLATTAWLLDARLATFAVLLLPLGGLAVAWLGRVSRSLHSRIFDLSVALRARAVEAAAGAEVLRSFGTVPWAEERVLRDLAELNEHSRRASVVEQLVTPTIQISAVLAGAFVVLSGALSEAVSATSVETVISVACALALLYRPIEGLLATAHFFLAGLATLDRIDETLALPILPEGTEPLLGARGRASLAVEDVHFQYGQKIVLRGTRLEVRGGEVVALVGPSGVGKSTLLSCIACTVRPTDGAVRFGDVALASLPDAARAHLVGWVPQEPFIVDATIAENVAFGAPIDLVRIRSALERAGALAFVEAREGGTSARLCVGNVGLSLGEQQRICIARALYREPAVLVLDEPTASLDATNEAQVLATLAALAKAGTGVLLATHRASTIVVADRVLELVDGRVCEAAADRGRRSVVGGAA